MKSSLRAVPAVHRFTGDPEVQAYRRVLGQDQLRSCVQRVLDDARASVGAGGIPKFEDLRRLVLQRLAAAEAQGLISVINGSGVLLHTNFGRAPLSTRALRAVAELGAGYTNLEYDLESGSRGDRYDRVVAQLREVTGAQAALIVNNCAAAVLLVLDTFARGREVVVSRGQLIEIGGGFRLPDVLRKSGATLVEVGTTNKTYPEDYRRAWTPDTALFMRTHPSNYRVTGFTNDVDAATLAALARELEVISFEDLGSGALIDLSSFGLPHEPTVADEIAARIDLVAVSGDKLLGGPQCGVIAGRADLIAQLRRNALLRALRVDKMTLAALGATLGAYLEPERVKEIPLFAMLAATQDELLERAGRICRELQARRIAAQAEVVHTNSATGGGTLPVTNIASAGVAIEPSDISADALAVKLRRARPPVVGRIDGNAFIIDLRTVSTEEEQALIDALTSSM